MRGPDKGGSTALVYVCVPTPPSVASACKLFEHTCVYYGSNARCVHVCLYEYAWLCCQCSEDAVASPASLAGMELRKFRSLRGIGVCIHSVAGVHACNYIIIRRRIRAVNSTCLIGQILLS